MHPGTQELSDLVSVDIRKRIALRRLPTRGEEWFLVSHSFHDKDHVTLLAGCLFHIPGRVIWEVDEPLLAFVVSANNGRQKNLSGLNDERHWNRGRGQESRPDSES